MIYGGVFDRHPDLRRRDRTRRHVGRSVRRPPRGSSPDVAPPARRPASTAPARYSPTRSVSRRSSGERTRQIERYGMPRSHVLHRLPHPKVAPTRSAAWLRTSSPSAARPSGLLRRQRRALIPPEPDRPTDRPTADRPTIDDDGGARRSMLDRVIEGHHGPELAGHGARQRGSTAHDDRPRELAEGVASAFAPSADRARSERRPRTASGT
jgi:hypothetical protein